MEHRIDIELTDGSVAERFAGHHGWVSINRHPEEDSDFRFEVSPSGALVVFNGQVAEAFAPANGGTRR